MVNGREVIELRAYDTLWGNCSMIFLKSNQRDSRKVKGPI